MILLFLLLLVLTAGLIVTLYLLGFQLGGSSWQSEAARVRHEAALAERQLHELTRRAFVAMAEEAERRRRDK